MKTNLEPTSRQGLPYKEMIEANTLLISFGSEEKEHNNFQFQMKYFKKSFLTFLNDDGQADKCNIKVLVISKAELPMQDYLKEKNTCKLAYIERMGTASHLSSEELAYKVSLFDKMYEEGMAEAKKFSTSVREFIKFKTLEEYQVEGKNQRIETHLKHPTKPAKIDHGLLKIGIKTATIEGNLLTVQMEVMQ